MAIVTTDNRYYSEIASAIREKTGGSALYTPAQMAAAIKSIQGGEAMSIETIWEICGYEPPPELPVGYTMLEYIESSGGQYINTGFKPDKNTRVVMDAQSVVAGAIYYGCRASSSSTDSKAFVVLGLSAGGVRSDYFGSTKSLTGVVATKRITLDQNKNVFTAGGSAATHTATTNASSLDLYLCAINQAGSATTISGKGIKTYSCQIYDNGTPVRDFVPCINPSGAYGLYDMVNAQFYANAGSGSFTGA
jgi:hypothetical protein